MKKIIIIENGHNLKENEIKILLFMSEQTFSKF